MSVREANGKTLLTAAEFKAAAASGRKLEEATLTAAYRVIVKGEHAIDVARDLGIQKQAVYRAEQTLRRRHLERNNYPADWIEAVVVAPADMLEKFKESVEKVRRKIVGA
jgi:predicted DNA-binding transcriptional regulator